MSMICLVISIKYGQSQIYLQVNHFYRPATEQTTQQDEAVHCFDPLHVQNPIFPGSMGQVYYYIIT